MTHEEDRIIQYLDLNELDIFSVKDIEHILPYSDLEKGFRQLKNRDYVIKIEKGKYCRSTFQDEFVIASYLVKDGGVAYWSALNYHGLTEQIPNVVFVQTSQQKRSKTIQNVRYRFIMVKKEKITGFIEKGYGNHRFRITDVEKTIVDCFDQPQYAGGHAVIIQAYAMADLSAQKLVKYCKSINNIALTKRLAYLAELLNKPKMNYFINYALSVRNERYSPFLPQLSTVGVPSNRRWRLLLNLSEDEIINMSHE